jgi:hypothetical protein
MGSALPTAAEDSEMPLGWSVPGPPRAPRPTVALALFACGFTVVAWGVDLEGRPAAVLLIGAALLLYSFADWLGAARRRARARGEPRMEQDSRAC